MKYLSADFKISCQDGMMQIVRDLLADAAGNAGFESFVETDYGLCGYIQEKKYSKVLLDNCINELGISGIVINYSINELEDKNWNSAWEQSGFDPIHVGKHITIYDAKHTEKKAIDNKDGQINVFVDAVQAFGTGTHYTTRMVVRCLESLDLRGKDILDCGCGTGILGIVASKMGAKHVTAYDIDKWSADNARHNATINGVDNMDVFLGDSSVLTKIQDKFDVVLANINRNILLEDMPQFYKSMRAGAKLVLSGFYEADIELLEKKAVTFGLNEEERIVDDNWSCIVLS